MISVVMPAYNAAETIQDSIESVVKQTYDNWELIIVNDHSTDETQQRIDAAAKQDARIRVYHNSQNLGVAKSRNLGISQAQGEWVAFLDSDDLWHEEKLEKQLGCLIDNNGIISYTATAYMDATGNHSSYVLRAKSVLTYKDLLTQNLMSCSSVMVKREVILENPFVKIASDLTEDYLAWLTILRKEKYAYGVDECLLIYRLSNNSRSSNRVRSGLMTYRSYRQAGLIWIMAGLFTARYTLYNVKKRLAIRRGMA